MNKRAFQLNKSFFKNILTFFNVDKEYFIYLIDNKLMLFIFMKTDYFKISFLISIIVGIVGTFVIIEGGSQGNNLLIVALLSMIIYAVLGIIEVHNTSRSYNSKLLWTVGFIIFSAFTALLWLVNRKTKRRVLY